MRITGVRTAVYRVPPAVRIEDSIQRVSHWELVVTTLTTDGGPTGTGLAYTNGFGGTAVRELVDTYVAPLVVGQDPVDVERIWRACWWELHSLGSGGMIRLALAAIDIALWDILAQHAQVPLYRLLGGTREGIPAYASAINAHLDGEPLVEQMRGFVAQGYRALKMKVGRDNPAEDVERVGAVRRAIGPGVKLMLDVNQAWTAGEAVRRTALVRPFDPFWLEEPILADDRQGHVQVRALTGVPIAVGETLYTRYEFADYMRAGAVDIVQADVIRVGGYTEWMKIAKLAESFNLPVAPHFMMELSVHALCAVPNGLILEDLRGGSLTDMGLLAEPVAVKQGELRPPARPGHGIALNVEALRPYEVTGPLHGLTSSRSFALK
jgi:L-alanine-DL-glutamate epimerase-like enolase superfamily enzyme